MSRWKLRDDKIELLIRGFRKQGVHRDHIHRHAGIPASSAKRILEGQWVRSLENQHRLFVGFLGLNQSDLSADERKQIDAVIEEYCLEEDVSVTGAPRSVQPDSPGATTELRQPKPEGAALAAMVAYIKFLHLTDMRSSPPVYRKLVPRLNRRVEVYDEFLMTKTLLFRSRPESHRLFGRSMGVVDLAPVYPPRHGMVVSDLGQLALPNIAEHLEREPDTLSQSVFHYVNGFQAGNEDVGAMLPESCDRIVLMVDMSSLPADLSRLLPSYPAAYHFRSHPQGIIGRRLLTSVNANGWFVADTSLPGDADPHYPSWNPAADSLLRDDKIELRFAVNWEALRA